MTDITSSGEPEKKPANKAIAWLALLGAAVGGAAAFIENVDKIDNGLRDGCRALGLCAAERIAPPVLAPYDSPGMGGGSDPDKQCRPQQDAYAQQFPQFKIVLRAWEDNNKDFWGHVTYHYHCRYSAIPNS